MITISTNTFINKISLNKVFTIYKSFDSFTKFKCPQTVDLLKFLPETKYKFIQLKTGILSKDTSYKTRYSQVQSQNFKSYLGIIWTLLSGLFTFYLACIGIHFNIFLFLSFVFSNCDFIKLQKLNCLAFHSINTLSISS